MITAVPVVPAPVEVQVAVSLAVAGEVGIATVHELDVIVGVIARASFDLVLKSIKVFEESPNALMVKVFPEHAIGMTRVTVANLKDPAPDEFEKLVAGVRVKSPQAVACEIPWPNSTVPPVLIPIVPANVDPIVGIKITAARPSAILRLRVLLFFFTTGSSSEPRFNAFISYLLFSRF